MVRVKERYLLVNILYPSVDGDKRQKGPIPDFVLQHQPTVDALTAGRLAKAITAEVSSLYGDYGVGALGNISIKYLSNATSTFIIRCSRAHYQLLWSTLTFMDHVPVKDGQSCVFRVVRVSGTIRKVEEECIRQARRLMLAAQEAQSGQSGITAFKTQTHEALGVEDSDEDMADG